MMYYTTDNGAAWIFGMLGMGLFWIVLIGGIIWAFTRWGRSTPQHATTPLETLQHRYARGEIDTPTFEHMREQLHGVNKAVPPLR